MALTSPLIRQNDEQPEKSGDGSYNIHLPLTETLQSGSAVMTSKPITVSVLGGSQPIDGGLQQILQNVPGLRLLKGAQDPDTFLTSYAQRPPELVLVELNGRSEFPAWFNGLAERLPRSKVFICSLSE